jgi:epoxyqueuosine reductase
MTTKIPELQFIPLSNDVGKIRFFGSLMPALLLLKASPLRFFEFQIKRISTPRTKALDFIQSNTDDAGRVGDVIIFIHRWQSREFDPFTFARARTFLAQITRLVQKEGFLAEPLDPLSPDINLPITATRAGLGNLSPYGLLVHPEFGPRLIITGLRTNAPFTLTPRWNQAGCNDCLACMRICPQKPMEKKVINLGKCQSCAKCFSVCPIGPTFQGKDLQK